MRAGLIVVNIAQRIDRHNRTDLQRPHLHGIAADAGLHAVVHAQQFAHGCAGARAIVAVAVVAGFRVHTGLIRHGSIRVGVGVSHGQVKQIRLADQRHLCDPDIKTDAALLKIPHNAAGRVQSKGTGPPPAQ